jgi:HD-GYP domain-containing protein (c-di-GMP phosphodiesterase class II)
MLRPHDTATPLEQATVELFAVVEAMEQRNRPGDDHSASTARTAYQLALAAGLSADECSLVFEGSLLHDIGFAVAERPPFNGIHNEPKDLVRLHPKYGGDYVLSHHPNGKRLCDFAYLHQENIDGSGYPFGIRNVPFAVQLVSIADTYAALRAPSRIRNRAALSRLDSVAIIRQLASARWSPAVTQLLEQCQGRLG